MDVTNASRRDLEHTLDRALTRVQRNVSDFGSQFPSYGRGDHTYRLTPNQNWLAAFWAGLLWLRASKTGDPADVQRAAALLPSFAQRLEKHIRLNHDLGFLFTLSARAQWQQTAYPAAHALALQAADVLLARFHPIGGYIQAWDAKDDPDERGRFIIDCMMNLPLLYWATRETGNPVYADAATAHAQTSRRYLLRENGASYHTYFLNADTGEPVGPKTHQGYDDHSLWARGQAWAVYGFTMAAEWTGDEHFLEAATAAADCYLQEAPADGISPWDYRLAPGAAAHPDTSADAIAAGGLLRLAALTKNPNYRHHAEKRLSLLVEQAYDTRPDAQGLLLHGTQHAPHEYGVDTYTIFGDFFFLEAVMKFIGNAPDFWGPNAK